MTRARNGDRQAWDVLVERYAPLIWSICRRYGISGPAAEDVVQHVWLHLVESLNDLRDPAALPGWISTTTRRECCRIRRVRGLVADDTQVLENLPDGHARRLSTSCSWPSATPRCARRCPPAAALPAAAGFARRRPARALRRDQRPARHPGREHRPEPQPLPGPAAPRPGHRPPDQRLSRLGAQMTAVPRGNLRAEIVGGLGIGPERIACGQPQPTRSCPANPRCCGNPDARPAPGGSRRVRGHQGRAGRPGSIPPANMVWYLTIRRTRVADLLAHTGGVSLKVVVAAARPRRSASLRIQEGYTVPGYPGAVLSGALSGRSSAGARPGVPNHRLRRPRRQQVDRGTNRLVHQEIRQDRPPLPHDTDPGRPAHDHRRRPSARRPPPSPRRHQPHQLDMH